MIPLKRAPFRTAAAFRAWLERHHATASELVVRIFKVHAASRGMTYAQALDEALCFGWVDGVRHGLDSESFTVRFAPRKPRSLWSRVNAMHVERLIRAGRMTRSGLAAYAKREAERTGVYSYERGAAELAPAELKLFRASRRAWSFFGAQAPWYRRASTHWVASAKRTETRKRRLATLIACSARREPVPSLDRRTSSHRPGSGALARERT